MSNFTCDCGSVWYIGIPICMQCKQPPYLGPAMDDPMIVERWNKMPQEDKERFYDLINTEYLCWGLADSFDNLPGDVTLSSWADSVLANIAEIELACAKYGCLDTRRHFEWLKERLPPTMGIPPGMLWCNYARGHLLEIVRSMESRIGEVFYEIGALKETPVHPATLVWKTKPELRIT